MRSESVVTVALTQPPKLAAPYEKRLYAINRGSRPLIRVGC